MVKFAFDTDTLKTPENIKVIRLKYIAEDIVAYLFMETPEDDDFLKPTKLYLFDPAKVLYITPATGYSATIGLMEWIPRKISEDEAFEIYADDILTIAEPSPLVKDLYLDYLEKINEKVPIIRKPSVQKPIDFEPTSNNEISNLKVGSGLRAPGITDEVVKDKILQSTFVMPKKKSIN